MAFTHPRFFDPQGTDFTRLPHEVPERKDELGAFWAQVDLETWFVKPLRWYWEERAAEIGGSLLGEALELPVALTIYWGATGLEPKSTFVASRKIPGMTWQTLCQDHRTRTGIHWVPNVLNGMPSWESQPVFEALLGISLDLEAVARDVGGLMYLGCLTRDGDMEIEPAHGDGRNLIYDDAGRPHRIDFAHGFSNPLLRAGEMHTFEDHDDQRQFKNRLWEFPAYNPAHEFEAWWQQRKTKTRPDDHDLLDIAHTAYLETHIRFRNLDLKALAQHAAASTGDNHSFSRESSLYPNLDP